MFFLKHITRFLFLTKIQKILSHQWCEHNKDFFAKVINFLIITISTVMIAVGFLTFSEELALYYARIRTIVVIISILLLTALFYIKDKSLDSKALFISFTLIFPAILFNLQYFFYIFSATEKPFSILFGTIVIMMGLHIILCRFAMEHLLFTLLTSAVLVTLILLTSHENLKNTIGIGIENQRDIARVLLEVQIGFFVFTKFLIRNKNAYDLEKTYNNLRTLVPARIAHFMTVNNININKGKAFLPQQRKLFCLCSDWRNFQNLTVNYKNGKISELYEIYYEEVCNLLQKNIPEGTYYWDWVADELFLVIYNENNNEDEILERGILFSHDLATILSDKIRDRLNIDLIFDIGMSYGVNLFGIMGPKYRKKTTVAGDLPGKAKRFETEAKIIRNKQRLQLIKSDSYIDLQRPIVVMDDKIAEKAKELGKFSDSQPTVAVSKNIEGRCINVFFHKKRAA